MDRLRIDRFKGVYSNVDKGSLSPDFLSKALNVRFKTGYIESQGFTRTWIYGPSNIVYSVPIALDEDRFGNKFEEGRIVPDYTQSYSYYLLYATKEVDQTLGHIYLGDSTGSHFIGYVNGSVIKTIELAGKVVILTDTGYLYELAKIKRWIWTATSKETPVFVNDIFLYEIVKPLEDSSLITIDFKKASEILNEVSVYLAPLDPDNDDTPRTKDGFTYSVWAFQARDSETDEILQIPGFDPNYMMFYRIVFTQKCYLTDSGNGFRTIWGSDPGIGILHTFQAGEVAYVAWYDAFEVFNKFNITEGWNIGLMQTSAVKYSKFPKTLGASDKVYNGNSFLMTQAGVEQYIAGVTTMYTLLQNNEAFSGDQLFAEFVLTVKTEKGEYAIENINRQVSLGDNYVISAQLTETLSHKDAISYFLYVRTATIKTELEKNDFEMCVEFDIMSATNLLTEPKIIFKSSLNGIYLAQRIGIIFKKGTYKPVVNFKDYITINGIAYAIGGSNVYHASIGGGDIMNGVFHDYIPEAEGEFLADVNGDLGVFSSQLDLISAQNSGEGYLLFSFKDSMNFTIRDRDDIAESPEGILIHTNKGIYATNGYERRLISHPINDVIEKNYETGNIFYDDIENVLIYSNATESYVYDFDAEAWSQIYPVIKGKLSLSDEGDLYEVYDKKLYKLARTSDFGSVVLTPELSLDYPGIAKVVVYYIIEFEGKLLMNEKYVESSSRRTVMIGIPVTKKIPSSYISAGLVINGKLYSIEIWYDILGEFRNADFIPIQQTNPERFAELKQLSENLK